ncbi:MAG: hypothetical protein ACKOOL_06055 [Novosphingobium sp.]
MAWDLGKAMRKKEEFESARLLDFEFRQRARATRLLARALGIDEAALVSQIAEQDEAGVAVFAASQAGVSRDSVMAEFHRCLAQARKELIAERGDPTPYRLG